MLSVVPPASLEAGFLGLVACFVLLSRLPLRADMIGGESAALEGSKVGPKSSLRKSSRLSRMGRVSCPFLVVGLILLLQRVVQWLLE